MIYERSNKPFFMETDRLIIRRFTIEEAEAVCELSNDRMNSSMRSFDHQWPTDMEGCKNAADKNRDCLNHFIGTPKAKEAMGYGQQDLYMPIRIKEGIAK